LAIVVARAFFIHAEGVPVAGAVDLVSVNVLHTDGSALASEATVYGHPEAALGQGAEITVERGIIFRMYIIDI
jgi:hypothetical protein